jgi:hypothetical protein
MARIGSEPLNQIACAFRAPSGQNVCIGITQGKPGLSFRAPSGRPFGLLRNQISQITQMLEGEIPEPAFGSLACSEAKLQSPKNPTPKNSV